MGFFHIFGLLCLLASTVLLIIVSVGLPVWDAIYFLKVNLSSAINSDTNGVLKMGQWGYCLGSTCTKAKLGYNLTLIQNESHVINKATVDIIHGLTYALILHPIAAGFTLIALLFAIGSHLVLGILGSIFSFFAFLVTIVALGIDLGLFISSRHRLDNLVNNSVTSSTNFTSSYGPALWLVVAAAVLQLLASFTVCFTHQSARRERRRDVAASDYPATTTTGRRGFFGRRNNNHLNNDNMVGGANDGTYMNEKPLGRRWFWQKNRGAQAY